MRVSSVIVRASLVPVRFSVQMQPHGYCSLRMREIFGHAVMEPCLRGVMLSVQ